MYCWRGLSQPLKMCHLPAVPFTSAQDLFSFFGLGFLGTGETREEVPFCSERTALPLSLLQQHALQQQQFRIILFLPLRVFQHQLLTAARNHSPRCDYDIALRDPNRMDVTTIASFMEKRHQLTPSFRRALSSKLKRLVSQEKILRVRNSYMLKDLGEVNPAMAGPLVPFDGLMEVCSNGMDASLVDVINEASMVAAMKLAEADTMSALAEEAAKQVEMDLRLAEETDALLEAASSIFDDFLNTGQGGWVFITRPYLYLLH